MRLAGRGKDLFLSLLAAIIRQCKYENLIIQMLEHESGEITRKCTPKTSKCKERNRVQTKRHKIILILIFVPYLFLNQNAISHKQLIYKQLNYQD